MKTNKTMRILSLIAVVLCMLVVFGITAFAAETDTKAIATTDVAKIGDTGYATLQAALNAAAQNDETVTLIADTYEDIVIPAEFGGTLAIGTCKINSITNNSATAKIVINGNVVVENPNGSAITGEVINISGNGTLTAIANGDHAYGIGGDNTKSITIENVHITKVQGGHYGEIGTDTKYYKNAPAGGAAIGSGSNGAVITLTNVKIDEALGGSKAAGIGALYHTGVTVNITGCEIAYVEGGATAAGIGGSRVSSGATAAEAVNINIKNSTITAVGGVYAAGIGSGYDTHCQANQPICTIKIDGSTINATGGQYAAGIGTGYHNAGLDGEIKNSNITAKSGDKVYKDSYTPAQDIGFGVADLAREGSSNDSSVTYNGTVIALSRVMIGEQGYATLADALAAAKNGETITLLADITASEIIVINKAITLDGNNHKLTSTAGRAINVSGADGVTIKNLTINASGERAINVIQNATNVTIENVTATAANYTVNVAASAPNAVVAIKNSTLNGLCTVNVSAASAQVIVDNSTINCNDNNTTVGESYAALSLNKDAKGGKIIATGCTINVTAGSDSYKGRNGAENGTVTIDGSADGVIVMVAAITYANSDNYHAFASLAAAIEFAKAGDTITLLAPVVVEKGETLTLDKNVTITYTSNAVGEDMITVRGTLNVAAGKITYTNTDKTGNNVTVSTISAEPGSVVNVTGGIIENKTVYSTGSYAYAIDMLTNGSLGNVTVTISGGKVYSDYMAIRQFNNGTACKNSLTVTGGEIYGAKRAIQIHIKNDAAYLEISGGKIEAGEGGYALCLFPETATHIAVTGGNFIGTVYSGTNGFISGGTFSSEIPEEYCAAGYIPTKNADGTYGVVKNTVTIGSVEDLLAFANAVTGNKEYQGVKVAANSKVVVLLTADLDLTDSGFVGIGNGAANAFSGTFDGQGHTISNMTLSCNYYRGVGFFRSLGNGAVVKNVTFVNANVNNGAATGANHFYGVVAGFSMNLTLDNVDVKNSTVTCKYSGAAMVGCLEGATVIKNADIENVTLTTTNIRAAVYGIIGNSATGHTITTENNTVSGTKLIVNGETKPLAKTVAYGSWNAGQDYAESTYVAQIGEKKYSTLTAAIKAAQAGDTITMIGDVNGNVTIDKNLTIDGNGKTYTGTMTVNDNLTVTVQNVNFVNGGIAKATKSAKGNYTIKGCTFDGAGKYAYALSFKGANKITVEDCTVSNYMYGFLYVSSGAVNVSVKDVTVENCPNYAVYFGSGVNTASFENLTVKNSNNGFVINNTVNRAFTVKNCVMEKVGTAINHSKGTNTITCNVLGVNDFGGAALSQYAKVVGVQVGTKFCGSLADAFAAANDGDTIKVLGNITVSDAITNTKKVTLDLNGKTITGTDNATGSFAIITNKGELTITGNGKITLTATNNRGWNAYSSVISNTVGGKLIVENGTIEHLGGTDMAYGIDNLTNGKGTYAETIINGGTIKSTYRAIRMFLNGIEAQNILTVNGGVIEGANKSVWMQDPSKNANTGKLTVAEGATLNGDVYLTVTEGSTEWPVEVSIAASAVNGEVLTNTNVPECYVLENVNGTWEVNKYAVVIGGQYYFETLADAVAHAQNRNVLKLLCDCEGPGIVIDKNITIDFNGHTYTLVGDGAGSTNTKTNGFQILKGNTVEFKNGTVKVADEAASKYAMLIQNYANLKIRNMTLDGTNLDYSSKVSYVVSINSGRVYFIGNVVVKSNARNLAGDVAIDVYDYSAASYDLPMVDIPETVKIDEYATIADAAKAGKVLAAARASKVFYANIQQAIDNSASFSLVQDYVGPGFVIDKQVNINLGGFTLTINEGVGSANTKTNGIQILKGAKVGLSNGKIKAADNGKLAILIQNYGDVQITNVELDGTNLDYSSKVSYTLSINSGNVKLMGTNVIANDRNLPGDIAIDVYDYSAANYERPVVSIYSTTTYTKGKLLAAAKYGNYHYASLQQCIDKHGTATLVCDFAGPGVVINKNATINFAGFTYTITDPVGSTGTESNGFQVLAGNRLVMNGGTLKVADSVANKFYILVQNYGDLTLNSMTLDGTNLDKWSKTDGDSYTLSINSGNVNITGTSKITANNDGDKAFAFDVCDKTAWDYELPKVKVAATAAIEGNIEAAAKIGVNYYATLAQAIADRDNASSKDEIVLMNNIVLEDTLTISATKAIVLDLNGFTISQTKACTGHYAMIVNKAILTIKDSVGGGKISFTDNGAGDPNFGWGSYTIVNEGKMIVNSGIIENLSAQNANGSVKHMYCAIQQNNAKAQLQINGGTISTLSYRSIRINAGSLTFGAWATTEEGATIEGQVWIQPFADGITVNVNNGKFSPRGVDGSSIYVDNSSKTVAFRVNGGEFATKIGCANAAALKGAIRAGSFTEDAIEKTDAVLFHKNFVNK